MANNTNNDKVEYKSEFELKKFKRLKENERYFDKVDDVIGAGEEMLSAYSAGRYGVVFTNKRIIALSKKGATSKKTVYTSIPFSKITIYEIETAGHFDKDASLVVYITGFSKIEFEFKGKCNVKEIGACIAEFMDGASTTYTKSNIYKIKS